MFGLITRKKCEESINELREDVYGRIYDCTISQIYNIKVKSILDKPVLLVICVGIVAINLKVSMMN